VIASLGAGGAERVMTLLAGEWARRGNEVTLVTLGAATGDHYPLDPAVRRVALDLLQNSTSPLQALKNNVARLAGLRQALRASRPDVVISFMDVTNILTLAATAGLRVPVIVSERIDPRHYPIGGGWHWLRRRLYPVAAGVVVQTRAVEEWARQLVPAEKVRVIANPVEPRVGGRDDASPELQVWCREEPYIIAVGRLDRQKGFDLLLEAYARLQKPRPRLLILGEGPERAVLEEQRSRLGLEAEANLPGRVPDPTPYIAGSQFFILSSRYEGFPNVLLEAMAAGKGVLSFDCPSGPAELIENGRNGLLIEPQNIDGLAASMQQLLDNPQQAQTLGDAAQETARRYSLAEITDQWDALIQQLPGK